MMITLDRAIKEVWIESIKEDYERDFFLMEDTLKNAFYYHLRKKLNDDYLLRNSLRIYTELRSVFDEKSDIAIVKIDMDNDKHLSERIVEVMAIIELKFKSNSSIDPFVKDIEKIKKYKRRKKYRNCQFYLGFIHESEYSLEQTSWLTTRQQRSTWAQGSLTELSGFYNEERTLFTVLSHNNKNEDLNTFFV